MPEKIKKAFFRLFEDYGNDIYVNYTINDERFKYTLPDGTEVDDSDSEWAHDKIAIDKWLVENGAEGGSENEEGETVIIKHWW